MGVHDPAGLCERIPELTELASDAAIARAIERGSPHGVYRAIFWARFRGPLRDRRATLDALLARRRLFLQPIRSAPFLFTLNGIGATVYGSADSDPADGSYVTTHFATFVFVPLFPIAQYLVLDAPGRAARRSRRGKSHGGPLAPA